jgi:putative addiction module component (TIGR02574 family)
MAAAVTISRLSVSEKLKLMEELWVDLAKTPEQVPTPKWHREVLAEREELVRQGKAKFSPWAEAKKRLRRKVA